MDNYVLLTLQAEDAGNVGICLLTDNLFAHTIARCQFSQNFEHKGRLVMTDESGALEEQGDGTPGNPWGCPLWVGDSFAELEDWLVQCAAEWIADGPDGPMFQALEEAFESA